MNSPLFFQLLILNLATGLSILLTASSLRLALMFKVFPNITAISIIFWVSTVVLSGILSFTSLYHYARPNIFISILFAIGNTLVFGTVLLADDAMKGADGPVGFGVALAGELLLLIGVTFLSIGLIMLGFLIHKRLYKGID
jgi:hypothetical protein